MTFIIRLLFSSHCVSRLKFPFPNTKYNGSSPFCFCFKSTVAGTRDFHSVPSISMWSYFSYFKTLLLLEWIEMFLGPGTRPESSASCLCSAWGCYHLPLSSEKGGIFILPFLIMSNFYNTTKIQDTTSKSRTSISDPFLHCKSLPRTALYQWSGGLALPLDV